MNILDRYCLKEFLRYFAMLVISLVSLYVIVDFFERIRMFFSNQATINQVLAFYLFSIPFFVWQIMPVGVLIASFATFGSLSRNNEIVAMKACGINLYRIALSVISFAILISIIAFLISEFIIPYTNQRADHIRLREILKQEPMGIFKQNQLWYRGKAGIYNFKAFDARTNILQGISIYYLDDKFNLLKRIDAERGEWDHGRWIFSNLVTTTFIPNQFPELRSISKGEVDLPEDPEQFKTMAKNTENMGYFQLRHYIQEMQAFGYNATTYQVDMHGKLAFPLVSIIMAIIGISLSLKKERGSGISQSIVGGLAIGFSYWIVFALTISMGHAGTLPPILAAWAANILFVLIGGIMAPRLRT